MRSVAQLCRTATQATAGPGQMNYAPLDSFTLVHGLVGVLLGSVGAGPLLTLFIALGWEVAEHLLKDLCPVVFIHPSQDTLVNAAGDVVATMVGWSLGWILRARIARRAPTL